MFRASRPRCWTRACPGQDKAAYDRTANELIGRFEENFSAFEAGVGDEVRAAAIRAAA